MITVRKYGPVYLVRYGDRPLGQLQLLSLSVNDGDTVVSERRGVDKCQYMFYIVEVKTKQLNLFLIFGFALKTTNISLFSSRKSKELAFGCDRDNMQRQAAEHHGQVTVKSRSSHGQVTVKSRSMPVGSAALSSNDRHAVTSQERNRDTRITTIDTLSPQHIHAHPATLVRRHGRTLTCPPGT